MQTRINEGAQLETEPRMNTDETRMEEMAVILLSLSVKIRVHPWLIPL
jgi:hypothetical protein